MPGFLDEINGGFVVHTRASAAIEAIVGARIFPDVAPQDTTENHIIYTQADGHRHVTHQGVTVDRDLTLHVYAIAESQPSASALAELLEDYWLATSYAIAAGTTIKVCNGGIVDSGQWFPKDSSDMHLFYQRLVLRMLLSR